MLCRLFLELFHYALDQFFRVRETLHNELDVHHRLARPALALAINTVLPDQRHRVRDRVHGDRQPPAGYAHHGFVTLQFFLFFLEYRHSAIVTAVLGDA